MPTSACTYLNLYICIARFQLNSQVCLHLWEGGNAITRADRCIFRLSGARDSTWYIPCMLSRPYALWKRCLQETSRLSTLMLRQKSL